MLFSRFGIGAALVAVAASGLASPVQAAPQRASDLWPGFYAGLNAGYGWGSSDVGVATGDGPWNSSAVNRAGAALINSSGPDHLDFGSGLGGAQVGYNYMFGHAIVGLEADIDRLGATKQSSRGPFVNTVNGATSFFRESIEPDWLVTIRPRVGYAIGALFPFVTGGLAVGHQNFTDRRDATLAGGVASTSSYPVDIGKMQVGWTAGAGVEWAIVQSLSLRADYLHTEFGEAKGTGRGGGNNFGIDYSSAVNTNMVRVGVDYHFGIPDKRTYVADYDTGVPAIDWSGLYAGVTVGYAGTKAKFKSQALGPWGAADAAQIDATGTNALFLKDGFGGGQIGYTYQIGSFPIGIESDLSLGGSTTVDSSHSFFSSSAASTVQFDESVRTNWLATLRPRFGFAIGSLFPYVTGGLAMANQRWSDGVTIVSSGARDYRVARTETLLGWVAGGGIEYHVGQHWSVKAEYLRVTLDGPNAAATGFAGNDTAISYSSSLTENLGRIGLNYRF